MKRVSVLSLASALSLLLFLVVSGCRTTDVAAVACPQCGAMTSIEAACDVNCGKNVCPSCRNVQNFTKAAAEALQAYVGPNPRASVHVCGKCGCTVETCPTCVAKM